MPETENRRACRRPWLNHIQRINISHATQIEGPSVGGYTARRLEEKQNSQASIKRALAKLADHRLSIGLANVRRISIVRTVRRWKW